MSKHNPFKRLLDNDTIIEAYNLYYGDDSLTLKDMAEIYKTNGRTLRNYFKLYKEGLLENEYKPIPKALTLEDRNRAYQLYVEGETVLNLAKRFEVEYITMYKYMVDCKGGLLGRGKTEAQKGSIVKKEIHNFVRTQKGKTSNRRYDEAMAWLNSKAGKDFAGMSHLTEKQENNVSKYSTGDGNCISDSYYLTYDDIL